MLNKNQMYKIKNFLFEKIGDWSLCAFSKDEDLIKIMQDNYPEVLKSIEELRGGA